MSQQTEGRTKTFLAGGALAIHRRVRLSSGVLAYCGTTDTDCIGVTANAAFAANESVAVVLISAQGTLKGVAATTFAAEAGLYAGANGTVDDTGTVVCGLALEAATASSDVVEYVPAAAALPTTIARSAITQQDLQPHKIKIMDLAVWDSPSARAVIATGANDDLAVVYGTHLTACPTIETGDVKTLTGSRSIGFQFVIPVHYVAGETITLRVNAGMKTTVAGTSCTLDALVSESGDPTTDICATAATTINSVTAANIDFTITPTNVAAGDILDVVLTIAYVDSATGTAVIGRINSITMLLDVKG